MSQTKPYIKFDDYADKNLYLSNHKIEWLIEYGKIRETMFFKGETGDRYNIYVFTKRNKNTIDIHQVYDTWSHETNQGSYLATIKNYILNITGRRQFSWKGYAGETIKQLMRQGIEPLQDDKQFKIRYCRSAYFMKTCDDNEFTPWLNMKIDLKTGLLLNKPNKESQKEYNEAKNTDTAQRKRNYIANRENRKALARYKKAGGDTNFRPATWNNGERVENIDKTLETMDWSLIPIDDVFRHRNATLRSNIIEHYGMNAILATLEHEVVDEETIDGRHYKLLDVTIPDFSDNSPEFDGTYKGLYLEMINPSTGESHFEGVPNVSTTNWGSGLEEATIRAALTWRDNDIAIQLNNTWVTHGKARTEQYVEPIVLK